MNTKYTTIIGIILFAVLLLSATILYNKLAQERNITPNNILQQENAPDSGEELDISSENAQIEDNNNNNEDNNNNDELEIPHKQDSSNAGDESKNLAPDFTVYDSNGNQITLSSFRGRPVVLNFWASWCPPCRSEMPHFNKVYQSMNEEVEFLLVNLTDGVRETQAKASNFVQSAAFSFPIYFDLDFDAAYTYNFSSIPFTIFIDADGYIINTYVGSLSEHQLINFINMIKK